MFLCSLAVCVLSLCLWMRYVCKANETDHTYLPSVETFSDYVYDTGVHCKILDINIYKIYDLPLNLKSSEGYRSNKPVKVRIYCF